MAQTYALRFISGKYQGGEFPLRSDREIVVGRSSELDMVLVEDMVSRKHAKITAQADAILIQDLGSTNGTFVNGEKIKKVRLKEGDRILIGTSIIKMIAVDSNQAVSEEKAREQLRQTGQRQNVSGAGKPMSGSIDEIPLPDLLQLLSTSRKSGVLSVRGEGGLGRIYLRKGQIYFASVNEDRGESFSITPRKAMFRILTWNTGSFELEPPDEKTVLEEIEDSTEGLLMEGMRQLDEFRRIEGELPAANVTLSIASPLEAPLKDLKPTELELLQLIHNVGRMPLVLDRSPRTDLETATGLLSLMQKGYVALL
jgi:pSer/pThr/pTyr-binding forkhead associated (FHA) protein